MNVWLEVSVMTMLHVTILMDHTVVNVTKVLLGMERTAQVFRTFFVLKRPLNIITKDLFTIYYALMSQYML